MLLAESNTRSKNPMSQKSTPVYNPADESDSSAQPTTDTQKRSLGSSSAKSESHSSPLPTDLLRIAGLMDCVHPDPNLTSEEREVTLRASESTDAFSFFSDSPGFTRRALRESTITVTELQIKTEDGVRTQIEYTDELSSDDIPSHIYGCRGTIPIRDIEVSPIGRDHDRLAGLIS